jgi:hypothetical protein
VSVELDHQTRLAIRHLIDKERRRREGVEADGLMHGTDNEYSRGCRCDDCRAAHTEARRDRKRRRQQMLAAVDRTSPRWQRVRSSIGATSDQIDPDIQADIVCATLAIRSTP